MGVAWWAKQPRLRRLLWRVSRNLYCSSRGEFRNRLDTNGETYVQSCVINCKATDELTVFDVGANLGEWTRLLLEQLPGERVPATRILMFEPVPTTFEQLKGRVAAFEHSNVVETYRLALSDETGQAEMLVLSEAGGTNSLHFDSHLASGAIDRINVDKTTLDAFCEQQAIGHIQLLKCDAEGHDAHVIRGARKLLQAGRVDVVQFEYNHRWVDARSYLKDVFELIEGLPYRIARVCPGHIEVIDQWHFELERYFEANYLIAREPALQWFDVRFGSFDVSNTYA